MIGAVGLDRHLHLFDTKSCSRKEKVNKSLRILTFLRREGKVSILGTTLIRLITPHVILTNSCHAVLTELQLTTEQKYLRENFS